MGVRVITARTIGIVLGGVSVRKITVEWPSPTAITAAIGAVVFILQLFGFTVPAINSSEINRTARVSNLDELRRCVDERNEYRDDWKICMEDPP